MNKINFNIGKKKKKWWGVGGLLVLRKIEITIRQSRLKS